MHIHHTVNHEDKHYVQQLCALNYLHIQLLQPSQFNQLSTEEAGVNSIVLSGYIVQPCYANLTAKNTELCWGLFKHKDYLMLL